MKIHHHKKEFNSYHKSQDTFCVNLLYNLAYTHRLKLNENKILAKEAQTLFKKDNYVKGQDCTCSISYAVEYHIASPHSGNVDGLPQKNLDKHLQPFSIAKSTRRGIGLGLSFSYDSVKAQPQCASEEGVSTVFTVVLPA